MVAGGREKHVFHRQAAKRREERGLYFYSKQPLSSRRKMKRYQDTQSTVT